MADLVNPEGNLISVQADDLAPYLAAGYSDKPDAIKMAQTEANLKAQTEGVLPGAEAFTKGALSAGTLGLSDQAMVHVLGADPKYLKALEQNRWVLHGLGAATGIGASIAAGVGAPSLINDLGQATSRGVRAAMLPAELSPGVAATLGLGQRLVTAGASAGTRGLVEGSIYGLGNVIDENAVGEPQHLGEAAAQVGMSGLLVGSLGVAGGVLGELGTSAAPKVVDALEKWRNESFGKALGVKGLTEAQKDVLGDAADQGSLGAFTNRESFIDNASKVSDAATKTRAELLASIPNAAAHSDTNTEDLIDNIAKNLAKTPLDMDAATIQNRLGADVERIKESQILEGSPRYANILKEIEPLIKPSQAELDLKDQVEALRFKANQVMVHGNEVGFGNRDIFTAKQYNEFADAAQKKAKDLGDLREAKAQSLSKLAAQTRKEYFDARPLRISFEDLADTLHDLRGEYKSSPAADTVVNTIRDQLTSLLPERLGKQVAQAVDHETSAQRVLNLAKEIQGKPVAEKAAKSPLEEAVNIGLGVGEALHGASMTKGALTYGAKKIFDVVKDKYGPSLAGSMFHQASRVAKVMGGLDVGPVEEALKRQRLEEALNDAHGQVSRGLALPGLFPKGINPPFPVTIDPMDMEAARDALYERYGISVAHAEAAKGVAAMTGKNEEPEIPMAKSSAKSDLKVPPKAGKGAGSKASVEATPPVGSQPEAPTAEQDATIAKAGGLKTLKNGIKDQTKEIEDSAEKLITNPKAYAKEREFVPPATKDIAIEIGNILAMAANPIALHQQVVASVGDMGVIAPAAAAQAAGTMSRSVAYLASIAPQTQHEMGEEPGANLSRVAAVQFATAEDAILHPMKADWTNPVAWGAIQAVYPDMANQIKATVMSQPGMDYEGMRNISNMIGMPLRASLDPAQQALTNQIQSIQPPPKIGQHAVGKTTAGGKPARSSVGKIKSAQMAQTQMQAQQSGEE